MAPRTKAQAERLYQEQLAAAKEEMLKNQEAARLQQEAEAEAAELEMFSGDAEPDAYAKIRAYCATSGTEDSLGIYRQLPQKQEMFICKIAADEFDPEIIKARFGGGTFIIKGYDEKNRIKLRQFISIEGEPIIESKPAVPAVVAAPAAPQFDMHALAALLAENNRQLLNAIGQSQVKPRSTAEILEEMKLMRDILAPASAQPAQQFNPVELLKLGMEMNGGGSDNAWALKAMEMFGKPIMDGMIAAKSQAAVPARAALPDRQTTPIGQQQQEESAVNLMLKGYIKMVGQAAAQNQNVEEYADTILNLVPESQLPEVEALLRADDWQTKLAAYSADVNTYPQWFAQLRQTLLAYIDEDRALTTGQAGDSLIAHENANSSKNATGGDTGGHS